MENYLGIVAGGNAWFEHVRTATRPGAGGEPRARACLWIEELPPFAVYSLYPADGFLLPTHVGFAEFNCSGHESFPVPFVETTQEIANDERPVASVSRQFHYAIPCDLVRFLHGTSLQRSRGWKNPTDTPSGEACQLGPNPKVDPLEPPRTSVSVSRGPATKFTSSNPPALLGRRSPAN